MALREAPPQLRRAYCDEAVGRRNWGESAAPKAGDKPQRYKPPSPPLWIPAFAGMTIALGGRTDECGGGGIQAHSRPRNIIFVPMTTCGLRTIEMALVG